MAVLRFTGAGVVSTPTAVQIRVTRTLPGRLAAGAPIPDRTLSDEEVEANLRHFVVGLRGPRSRACDALVLSGVRLGERHGLAEVVRAARGWGLRRVSLHLGRDQRLALRRSPLAALVDDLAIVVRNELDLGLHGQIRITLPARLLSITTKSRCRMMQSDNFLKIHSPGAPRASFSRSWARASFSQSP